MNQLVIAEGTGLSYPLAVLLGVVQGITEFLPVSSDGHLVLAEHYAGLKLEKERLLALNVFLHVGTLCSILVVYWKKLLSVLKRPQVLVAVFVATLPLIPVGLFCKKLIEDSQESMLLVGLFLCFTGVTLWFAQRKHAGERGLDQIGVREALIVGLLQAIAPLPGVSRSGTTISGGLMAGLRRDTAGDFSFIIAVPAICGAVLMEGRKLFTEGSGGVDWWPIILGTVVSFLVGLVSLKVLLKVVTRGKLHWFGIYCVVVGLFVAISGGGTH